MSDSAFGTAIFAILLACGIVGFVWASYSLYYMAIHLYTRGTKPKGGNFPRYFDFEGQANKESHSLGEGVQAPEGNQDNTDSRDATLATMDSSASNADSEQDWWTPDPAVDYPVVTIQATAYNEISCIEGLLRNMVKMYWPKDKLQIQLLDDSTLQEAVDLADKVIADIAAKKGFTIEHCHRENRVGYKAGNLLHHFPSVRGKYVAIFDADFLPKPDFLLQTIPHFYNTKGEPQDDVCLVQATWDHFNQTDNLLTQAQGLVQNFHFIIQQNARYHGSGFLPFNGTAGVWQTKAIEQSGIWNMDTVTEDLDIACRAKLHGYRFVFLDHVSVPSELPPTMMAYRRQQRRWTQGHMQVGRKVIQAIWKSHSFPLKLKIDMTYICFYKLDWLFTLVGILVVPLIESAGLSSTELAILGAFGLYGIVIWFASMALTLWDKKFTHPHMTAWERMCRVYVIPFFLVLSLGMGLWQFVAIIEGLIQNDIPFATTPKKGKSHALDQDAIERQAEIDDEDNEMDQQNCNDEYKEFHYDGWDNVEGMETKVKRRPPGCLSKTFPQWAHFVEICIGLYLLLMGVFYENKLWAIPIFVMSTGFFWVSIPGIYTSFVKGWKKVLKKTIGSSGKQRTNGACKKKKTTADASTAVFDDGSSNDSLETGGNKSNPTANTESDH